MKLALFITAVVAVGIGFSLRESVSLTPTMWFGLWVPYLALGALAIQRFHRDGTLADTFRIRAGDFSLGFLIAALIFAGAWVIKHTWLTESSPKMVWLLHLALQAGGGHPSPTLVATIVGIGALEEVVWRGLALSSLTETFGSRRAWPIAAVLYALAHLPAAFTLADPVVGPNPLLVMAALGAGLVWSFAASMIGRLFPIIVSHVVFSYFAITVLLPRLG